VHKRITIADAYFATKAVVQTQRKLQRDFPGRDAPTRVTTKRLLDKFRETGNLQNIVIGGSGDHGQSGQKITSWL